MSKELTFKSGSEELQKNAELIAKELQRSRETKARTKELVKNSFRSWLEEILEGAEFQDMTRPLTPEQKKVLAAEIAEKYVEEELQDADELFQVGVLCGRKENSSHADQPDDDEADDDDWHPWPSNSR